MAFPLYGRNKLRFLDKKPTDLPATRLELLRARLKAISDNLAAYQSVTMELVPELQALKDSLKNEVSLATELCNDSDLIFDTSASSPALLTASSTAAKYSESTKKVIDSFKKLTTTDLDLSGYKISTLGLEKLKIAIFESSKKINLDLRNCQLTDDAIPHLKGLIHNDDVSSIQLNASDFPTRGSELLDCGKKQEANLKKLNDDFKTAFAGPAVTAATH